MKKLSILLLAPALMLACQSNQSSNQETDKVEVEVDSNLVSTTPQTCYQYIKNRDTAKLTIMTTNNITTGELSYNLYEKDKNKGILEGEMRGDTLVAEYTFNSEGKESTRQVVFLQKGEQLLEGFGDVEEKNGKMMFKKISDLKFGQPFIFEKVECK